MHPHQRAHYRIRYPTTARPLFVPGSAVEAVPVVDCSERGFRFRAVGSGALPEIGEPASGEIRFHSGTTAQVSGVVVRVQDAEVAVHLTREAIPFGVVLQEQLFLRKRYPFAPC